MEIASANSASPHKLRWRGLVGIAGVTANVRDVVVMTKEAVEFIPTDTGEHAAPVGNPEQVSAYETFPVFVIVYVAGDPAAAVWEAGKPLKTAGFTVSVKFCVASAPTPLCAVMMIG